MKTINIPDELIWPEVKCIIGRDGLKIRVSELIKLYGGLRAAARALNISAPYLGRLGDGQKNSPSKEVLNKLGLERTEIILYRNKKGPRK